MIHKLTPEEGVVRLCGVQGCCPTINFTNPEMVILQDDFGGKVQLTREQWTELKARFDQKTDHQG